MGWVGGLLLLLLFLCLYFSVEDLDYFIHENYKRRYQDVAQSIKDTFVRSYNTALGKPRPIRSSSRLRSDVVYGIYRGLPSDNTVS